MHTISRDQPRPIVMFAENDDSEAIRKAIKAGVSADIVDGLSSSRYWSNAVISPRLNYSKAFKATTHAAQRKLKYRSVLDDNRAIPAWIDETIRKAVHPNPFRRYDEISEFIHDLRHPNREFINKTRPPLIERSPVLF